MALSADDLRYDVILTGNVLNAASVEAAMTGLAQVLHISESQVAVAFAASPMAIKKDLDAAAAQRIQEVLQQLNLEVILRPIETEPLQSGDPLNQAAALSITSGSTDDGVGYVIDGNPDHGILTLHIPADGAIYGDSSAIVCLDSHIKMKRAEETDGLGTRYTSYINRFCAENKTGDLCLAAKLPGEIRGLTLTTPLRLRVSCYLASSVGVRFIQGEAANTECPAELQDRFLRCEGPGVIWLSACGGIVQIELKKPFTCRTDRILAWQGDIRLQSNHQDVTEIAGNGTLWLQTLSESALSAWARSLANS